MATPQAEAQAAQIAALTAAFKAQQNLSAAKIAALIAFYYQQRVNVEDPGAVLAWLELMIPRLIATSDTGARQAAMYYDAIRRIEVPGSTPFSAQAAVGMVDDGVRKSLLTVGPYDYINKMREIDATTGLSTQQRQAMLVEAKQVTTKSLAAAVVRHAQAGSRQTVYSNSEADKVALGWVRVTKAKPCFFCAMLASRGLEYREYKEGSFDLSDSRFTGDGDAKVHDNCGCCLKPVWTKADQYVKKTDDFREMWQLWGAHANRENPGALIFRRGYDHWLSTGEMLDADHFMRAA